MAIEDEKVPQPIAVNGGEEKPNVQDKEKVTEELSEEDQALREGLQLAVTRLSDEDDSIHRAALEHLSTEIRSATSSMTSVPKPLKFLRPHMETLKTVFKSWPVTHPLKRDLADVLSVLAMTMGNSEEREMLRFKLQGNRTDLPKWGHEYIRSLAGEIASEYSSRYDNSGDEEPYIDDLLALIEEIVPFQLSHNAEADACDLLMVTRLLGKLTALVEDERSFERVCLYLLRSASFVADPDDLQILLQTTFELFMKQNKRCDALRVALRMNDEEQVKLVFASSDSIGEKRQLALLLARHRSHVLVGDEELDSIGGNSRLSEQFLEVTRLLDVAAPKTVEEIYKNDKKKSSAQANVDSLKANVASTYVNAFVNAGLCNDPLMSSDNSDWIFKNKNFGSLAAAASLGLVNMWNVEESLNKCDKFFHASDEYLKAGACLAVGLSSSAMRHESDPALALLSEYLTDDSTSPLCRSTSLIGIAVAYAGQRREEVRECVEPLLLSESVAIADASFAALALGIVFAGSCHDEICGAILQRFMESTETDLDQSVSRFLALGLALLFIGQGERVEATIAAVQTIEHRRGKYAEIALQSLAHCASGDVLQVQSLLRNCTEHIADNKDAEYQMVSVLGLSLVAMGDDIGSEMTLRTFEHLLHYGELPIRRTVPLALALLYISNPEYSVVDQFSRLSHDADPQLSMNAIIGLGLCAAGTNNSRVANTLRQLSDFYATQADHLFCVRIAQGLVSMGRGLMTLSPFHSDRLLLSPTALASVITVVHACLDLEHTLLANYHYLLFALAPAMNPRYLLTVDDELKVVRASARVGLAVETVAQAGRPKTITGFQTHTTPVLLGFKDRAELAGTEYKSIASIVEGVVVIEKLPQQPTDS